VYADGETVTGLFGNQNKPGASATAERNATIQSITALVLRRRPVIDIANQLPSASKLRLQSSPHHSKQKQEQPSHQINTATARMVLEATMIVYVCAPRGHWGNMLTPPRVDNSEASRNGDYVYVPLPALLRQS